MHFDDGGLSVEIAEAMRSSMRAELQKAMEALPLCQRLSDAVSSDLVPMLRQLNATLAPYVPPEGRPYAARPLGGVVLHRYGITGAGIASLQCLLQAVTGKAVARWATPQPAGPPGGMPPSPPGSAPLWAPPARPMQAPETLLHASFQAPLREDGSRLRRTDAPAAQGHY